MSRRARIYFSRAQLICGFIFTVFAVLSAIRSLWVLAIINSLNAAMNFAMAPSNYGRRYDP